MLAREWFRENNPWLETFFPEQLPGRLLTRLNELHDARPAARHDALWRRAGRRLH